MYKFLDITGLTYLWGKIKSLVPDLSKKTSSIPFGQVDSTSTNTVFTAQIDGIDELRDGVCCYLRNGVVSSTTNWTLNINDLGAKPVYSTLAAASRVSTSFNLNYTMLFVYNSTRVAGGCWDMYYGIDTNTTYNLNSNYVSIGVVNVGAYPITTASLCAFDTNNKFTPFVTTATTLNGKTLVPSTFPIGAKIYVANYSMSENQVVPNSTLILTTAANVDLRYSSVNHNVAIFPNNKFNRIFMPVVVDIEHNTFTLTTQTTGGYVNNFTNERSLIAGNYYIDIGFNAQNTTSYYCTVIQNNNLYYYDGTNLIEYSIYKSNVGSLKTDNTTAQTPSASESFTGDISLHKIAKTGSYNDLLNKPTIPSSGDFVTSLGTSGNNVTWTKNGTTNNLTVPYATNAGTATKLGSSTVGSSDKPIYLNAGTPTVITSFPEAYLSWGGKNFSDGYGPIDGAMVSELGACRTMFTKAAGITIEYSTDGGITWLDYGVSDSLKVSIFSTGTTPFTIGHATAETHSADNMLRVTINSKYAGIYNTFKKFVLYVNTNGSSGSYCSIIGRTVSAYDNNIESWTTFADKVVISGWSGYNVINTQSITIGNNDSNIRQLCFVFGCTGHSSNNYDNYAGLTIYKIFGFGGVGWTTPSTMAKTGHLYSFDSSQNATFPANVTASKFIKSDGTSSQFLKADGSVDSNTYATTAFVNTATSGFANDADVVHKANAETITGEKTFNAGAVVSAESQLKFETAQDEGVYIEANDNSGDKVLTLGNIEDDSPVRIENVADPILGTDVANRNYANNPILMEKTFEPYTISAADTSNGYIFFLNVVPTSDNYFMPWKVKYKLFITTTESYTQGVYDCEIGSAGTYSNYSFFNRFYSTSYYPSYYHLLAFHSSSAKYANRETNPIKIGERINSARKDTTLARVFKIQVYEAINCEVSFPENIEKYGDVYTEDKYGYCSIFNATSIGLQETGDTYYQNYFNSEYYTSYHIHSTDTPLYRYKLCGFDTRGRLVPITSTNQTPGTIVSKIPNTVPMDVSKGIVFYSSTTAITSIETAVGTGTIYRNNSSGNSGIIYNFNTANIANCNVYLVGDYNKTTGMFTLDSSGTNSYYIYALNTGTENEYFAQFTEGKYYWLLGNITSSNFNFLIDNPLFYFDGAKLIDYNLTINSIISNSEIDTLF